MSEIVKLTCVFGGVGGTGLTLTLVLPIRFKACESYEEHLFNEYCMVTVMEVITNGKVIGLLSDLQGHRVH